VLAKGVLNRLANALVADGVAAMGRSANLPKHFRIDVDPVSFVQNIIFPKSDTA
jgi:hypothetical protein